jgi:hypothetical protein
MPSEVINRAIALEVVPLKIEVRNASRKSDAVDPPVPWG